MRHALSDAEWKSIEPVLCKDPICFSPYLHRGRNQIERFFNRIKQCRWIATRYDKLAEKFLAFVNLAAVSVLLRVYESTPWSPSAEASQNAANQRATK